jgi:hypothetical protein
MSEFPIIHKLGGRDAAVTALREQGLRRGLDALRMWVARGGIPGDAQRALMRAAERRGIAYTAADFEVPEEAPCAAAPAAITDGAP